MNDDKGTRANAIEEVERQFDEMVQSIQGAGPEEVEIDKENPFFAAMEKGMAKLELPPGMDQETMKAVVEQQQDFSKYIDQE
jgi:hypothetical protein